MATLARSSEAGSVNGLGSVHRVLGYKLSRWLREIAAAHFIALLY